MNTCRCECKASNCSGWLGGRSENMQTQLLLHDSDDDVGSDGEDGEAGTKVTPLSMPTAVAGTSRSKARFLILHSVCSFRCEAWSA